MKNQILVLLCFLPSMLIGQTNLFQKYFDYGGQDARAICKTKDGNYLVVTSLSQLNIIKMDENGDSIWTKGYNNQNGIICNGVKPHFDNGFVFGGSRRRPLSSTLYGFVSKIDSVGNQMWGKEIDLGLYTYINDIAVNADSCIVAVGYYDNSGYNVGFVIKIDASGNFLWLKETGISSSDVQLREVDIENNGDIIIAGDNQNSGIILMRLNEDGTVIWSKENNQGSSNSGNALEILPSGNILIGGNTAGIFGGEYDVFMHKFDASGNLLFSKAYGTTRRERIYEMELNYGDKLSFFGQTIINGDYQYFLLGVDTLGNFDYAMEYGDHLIYEGGMTGITGHDNSNWIMGDQNSLPPMIVKADSLGRFDCGDTVTLMVVNHSVSYSTGPDLFANTPSYLDFTMINSSTPYIDSTICTQTICNLIGIANVSSNYNGSDVSCYGVNDGQATVTVTGGVSPSFEWSGGANTTTITGLGDGTYYCIITDGVCSDTAYVTITNPEPVVVNITESNNPSCYGFSDGDATITASGGTGNYTCLWSNGGIETTETALSADLIYTVTVSDANGCQAIAEITLNNPAQVVVNISGTETICEGLSTTLSATGAYSYIWDNNAGTDSIITVSPLLTTTYSVTGTIGSCEGTAEITINVNPLPNVSINSFSPDTLCTTASPVLLPSASPSGGIYSGTGVTGVYFNPSITSNGTFSIYYTYTDANSCANVDSTEINVIVCTGMTEMSLHSSISICPNPTSGEFIIISGNEKIETISIFNQTGKKVYCNDTKSDKIQIDFSGKPQGVYFIKAETENHIVIERFILQ